MMQESLPPGKIDERKGNEPQLVPIGDEFDEAEISTEGSVPKVSIGLPVYNGIAFLERSLRSLLNQSFTDFEIVFVDNASTDGSYEFVRGFAGDQRIRIYRNHVNIGAIKNFQRALSLARADYFMWAAADDYWEPDFIACLAAQLDRHPEAGVAMSATRVLRQDARRAETVIRYEGALDPSPMGHLRLALRLGSLIKYNFFIYGLFRRDWLNQLLFPDGAAPERILLTELALTKSFRYVDEALYNRQVHNQKYEVRNPDTPYSRIVASGFLGDLEYLKSLSATLIRSRVIPMRRKLLIPLVVGRAAWTRVHARFLLPIKKKRAQRKHLAAKEEKKRSVAVQKRTAVDALLSRGEAMTPSRRQTGRDRHKALVLARNEQHEQAAVLCDEVVRKRTD